MSGGQLAFLFVASIVAGAVNSVAGGGTLLSFPAAVAAGLAPIIANATNAVAMVPGSFAAAWAYRRHLEGLERLTVALAIPGVAGGMLGAMILRKTPQRLFDSIVPWLVLGATVIILVQGVLLRRRAPRRESRPTTSPGDEGAHQRAEARVVTRWPMMLVLQFLVSIYGGYFGAAMGIVMLAFLGYIAAPGRGGRLEMHQMNAVKNVLAVVINGTASIDFLVHGLVRAQPALLMAVGAVSGGVIGGRLARRAGAQQVRLLVVLIGFAISALLAWRHYR
jgi:uncharacterized membrane protein YfcA